MKVIQFISTDKHKPSIRLKDTDLEINVDVTGI